MAEQGVIEQLKQLYDEVHRTQERIDHLDASLPLGIEPRSLNYDKDLQRLMGEYNRLVRQAAGDGLSREELESLGLPWQFDQARVSRYLHLDLTDT